MIVFVTSVRHPDNSHDYRFCWDLLGDTLASVCNQENTDFKVIVVANVIPHKFGQNDSHSIASQKDLDNIAEYVEWVKVDYPPRGRKGKIQTGIENVRVDKGCKLTRGLIAADKYNPDYVMFVDADDFISKNISSYVNNRIVQEDPIPGWTINRGYILVGENWRKDDDFVRKVRHKSDFKLSISFRRQRFSLAYGRRRLSRNQEDFR